LQRAEIIAKGKVQKVTRRDFVEDIAVELDIFGFVENIKPGDVKIIVEGSEEKIKEFIKRINIRKHPIDVKDLTIEFKHYAGEFKYFEIRRGDLTEEIWERGLMLPEPCFMR